MTGFTGLWITDEHVLTECVGDYPLLIPRHQRMAQGADGVIAAGAFVLTSATVPSWSSRGVVAGHVAVLATGEKTQDILVVGSVSMGSLTLRRVGLDTGEGSPPGGSAGLTSLKFEVPTCVPQIRENQRRLRLRYQVADDLSTAGDFTEALVLMVLIDLYGSLYRAGASPLGGGGSNDNFAAKLVSYRAELIEVLDVLDGQYAVNLSVGTMPTLGLLDDPENFTS